ncbi:MAG: ABC transporter permease subunit [Christensenellales bacterium]|jgi:putative aldouronate transport system permease protein
MHSKSTKEILLRSKKRAELRQNGVFILMLLPGLLILLVNNYLPMFGIVMAFQKIDFKKFAFFGKWVGLDNLSAFFKSTYSTVTARNTILYNVTFIVLGLIAGVSFAIMLTELRNRRARKVYQTIMFLPYFISWVAVSGIVVGFLGEKYGVLNRVVLPLFELSPIKWYSKRDYWPFILIFINLWKNIGYGSVMYFSAINGIDQQVYEAAAIDGAGKWKQVWMITIPLIRPMMVILTILNIGRIFNTDIGLFYTVPQLKSNGSLMKAVATIDTYVYSNLTDGSAVSSVNFAAAAAFLQSIIGFVLVLITNYTVKRIDENYALF